MQIDSGVSRRGQHLEIDAAEREMFAVAHRTNRETDPIRCRNSVDDLCTRRLGELEMTGEEVGMEVRLEHRFDRERHLASIREVLVDVAQRIHHHRPARRAVADQVARLRKATEVVLLEDEV